MVHPKQCLNIICFVTTSFLMCYVLGLYSEIESINFSFLSMFGIFLGLLYSIDYYRDHRYSTEFPIIQQSCFFCLKKSINRCCQYCFTFSLKALQIYYPLYIISSPLCKDSFTNNISSICSIRLLLISFGVSMVVTIVFTLSKVLIEIFNTQVYTFPVVPANTEQQNKTLADAMENDEIFLKHLACLDFNILSTIEGARRLKIFDLSPPANQAHCWNRTCTESLKLIQNLCMLLTKEYEKKQSFKLGATLNSTTPKDVGSQELFSAADNPVKKESLNKSWFSPGKLFQSPLNEQKISEKKEDVFLTPPSQQTGNVYKNLQVTLWCLEGLCNLVAASITEDKYGVVQQKLPDILAELLLLLEACEEFLKNSFNASYINHTQQEESSKINSHVISLKLALKTGLYTITTAFGYHITNVRLLSSHKKRLHGFLEFAE